jgi:charged multivesicular body protein 2A
LVLIFIRELNLPEMQRILKQFAKETDIMDMKEEMMNDGIDGVMEDEIDEEERYSLSC